MLAPQCAQLPSTVWGEEAAEDDAPTEATARSSPLEEGGELRAPA